MADHVHSPAAVQVPPELIERSQAGWKAFTQAIFINSVGVAAVLLFLLLLVKVF